MTVKPLTRPRVTLFQRLVQALRAMVALNRNPGDREAQHQFQTSLDADILATMHEEWERTPEGQRLLETRPVLDGRALSPARLLAMPEGTLGNALGRVYLREGITPFDAGPQRPAVVEYIAQRIAETHDLWHTVTGYGMDPAGELELHVFMWAQRKFRTAMVVILFGYLMASWRRGPLVMWRRARAAWSRGKRSAKLDQVWWEHELNRPIEHVRAELGLTRQVTLHASSEGVMPARASAPRA